MCSTRSGEPISTHLAIYALAAKRIDRTDDLQDGRGLIATNTRAGVAGGMLSPPPGLKADSRGLFRIDAMRLLPTAKDNPPTSLVSSQSRDVQLEIGSGRPVSSAGARFSIREDSSSIPPTCLANAYRRWGVLALTGVVKFHFIWTITRLTRQVELILKELLPSRPSLGNNCQGARSAACGVLPNSRGKVRSPKGEGRPPR